jgi:adenylate cyclase
VTVARADIDWDSEGLLDGLDDDARDARVELLEKLTADGFELGDLREAAAAGRLLLLSTERVLTEGPPLYTPREVAEEAGVDLELLERFQRAMGASTGDRDERRLGEPDLEAAKVVRSLLDAGLPEEGMLQVGRTMGTATARVAQSNRELIVQNFIEPGDTEAEVAERLAEAAEKLVPLATEVLGFGLRLHLVEQIRRDVIGAADLAAGDVGGADEVCVCFADLVGFTKLGEEIEAEQLGSVATRLEEMAAEVAEPPVRLVKLIGDAAMLAASEPAPLLEAALRLVELADEEGETFPQLRAGAAIGTALGRGGDLYGRPVNLASRITGIARPGSVLASNDLKEAATDGFSYSFAGKRPVKGLDAPVKLYRVRRGADGDEGDA